MGAESIAATMTRKIVCSFLIAFLSIIISRHTGAARDGDCFSLLCLGDILLANEVERHILSKGTGYPFEKIKDELRKYDFIIGNMEAPITHRGTAFTNKAYSFRVRPEAALSLRDLKIDAVSISNNHLMDYGADGMDDTISFLDGLNIGHAGGGKNSAAARRPARLRYGSTEIYILSYCNRPPMEYYTKGTMPGISFLDLTIIREDIATFKTRDNIVLVSLHWGIEHTHKPLPEQISAAHDIINAGADGIIGHHPHWPQGIEIYRNRPIIYSLGNFINGYYNPVEKNNMAVGLYFNGNRLDKIKILPVAGQNRIIKFQPFILTGKQADETLGLIRGLSKNLHTDLEIRDNYGIINFNGEGITIGTMEELVRPKRSAASN